MYGYRTPRSMKNQVSWDEGNRYSTNLMNKFGFLLLILSALGQVFPENEPGGFIVGMACVFGTAFGLIFLTEWHLKKMFEK